MSAVLDDFHKLKVLLDEQQRSRDQDLGALNNVLDGIEKDYGFKTIEEAKAQLDQWKKELFDLTDEYNGEMKALAEKCKGNPAIMKLLQRYVK